MPRKVLYKSQVNDERMATKYNEEKEMAMKNFIEVTDFDGGMNVLVPIGKITGIVCDGDGSVFIEMGTDKNDTSSGILVTESYDEIKAKLKESEV